MNKIFITIIISILLFFAYGMFSNINKKSAKTKRISCQNKTITFESITSKKDIEKSQNLLLTNNYIIKSNIEYSTLMPSILKNFFDIEKANDLLIKNIAINKYELNKEKLLIDYYIYENDKEDKNKKNDKAKLYAGYLLFEFKLSNKTLYKIQTDYMKQDGSDIEERIECVIDSFLSIK